MKIRKLVLLLLCVAIFLCGCSAKSTGEYNMGSPNEGGQLSGPENAGSGSSQVLTDRKLIRRISMDAETEDLDALLEGLTQHIAALGGYVESRSIYNGSSYSGRRYRTANLVIRIPAAQLDSFVQRMGESSNIVSTNETSDDVTLQYVDTQSRLKVLRTEEERLLQFLAEAASVSEMLEVEKRLTEVQASIESLTAQLKTYDNLVDYGTVTLSISEVTVYTPTQEPTVWQTIKEAFVNSLAGLGKIGKGLLVFCLGYSPYLLTVAVIGGGVGLLIRALDRRQKKINAQKKAQKEAEE